MFFLNGILHKRLYVHSGNNVVIAWNFQTDEQVKYLYTDYIRNRELAFTPAEASVLCGRYKNSLMKYVISGRFPRPQKAYALTTDKPERDLYWLSSSDVLKFHAFLGTLRRGHQPKNGFAVAETERLIPRQELEKLLAGGNVLYRVDEKGNMVPVWKA
jgi:hypothetical protein